MPTSRGLALNPNHVPGRNSKWTGNGPTCYAWTRPAQHKQIMVGGLSVPTLTPTAPAATVRERAAAIRRR